MRGKLHAGAVRQSAKVIRFLLVKHARIVAFNGQGAVVFFTRAAVENLDVDDGAFHSRGNLEGGVFHIPRLFAEDSAEQLFFRRKLGFALGGDFAHKDIIGLNSRADADDAALVEVAQHVFADVGNIAGDFLRSKLGIAGHYLEFFNMNGGKGVFANGALGNEDGVFVVVTAPGHEGDHQVFAEGQFAFVNAGAVGQNLAFFHRHAGVAGGLLPKARVLVRLVELQQVIGAHAALLGKHVAFIRNDEAVGVHIFHLAGRGRNNARARVAGHVHFHAGSHQGLFGTQQGHGLTLHV